MTVVESLTAAVCVLALAASTVLFVTGMIDLVQSWGTRKSVTEAATSTAGAAKTVADKVQAGGYQQQSGFDAAGQLTAVATLAASLKDVDRGTRLLLLSLAFLLVAGVAAGAASIGAGLSG